MTTERPGRERLRAALERHQEHQAARRERLSTETRTRIDMRVEDAASRLLAQLQAAPPEPPKRASWRSPLYSTLGAAAGVAGAVIAKLVI